MKKIYVIIGVIGILLLMVSTATAVPTAHSEPLMNYIEQVETTESLLKSKLNSLNLLNSQGILDIIIQLITLIIRLIMEIIAIIQGIIGIISLIQTLINAVQVLFDLIMQLIELITSIFNPDAVMA
jgi:hypothetical protein